MEVLNRSGFICEKLLPVLLSKKFQHQLNLSQIALHLTSLLTLKQSACIKPGLVYHVKDTIYICIEHITQNDLCQFPSILQVGFLNTSQRLIILVKQWSGSAMLLQHVLFQPSCLPFSLQLIWDFVHTNITGNSEHILAENQMM